MKESSGAFKMLSGKLTRKRPLTIRCRHRREGNIRMDLKEIGLI